MIGGLENTVWGGRVKRVDEVAEWHRRDEMVAVKFDLLPRSRPPRDTDDAAVLMPYTLDAYPAYRGCAAGCQAFRAALPHHPRAKARIVELLNERGNELPILGASGSQQGVA